MAEINYIPGTADNLVVKCLGCGDKRVAAYQCTCGEKFCKTCHPESFSEEDDSDILEITCPKCGAKTLFV